MNRIWRDRRYSLGLLTGVAASIALVSLLAAGGGQQHEDRPQAQVSALDRNAADTDSLPAGFEQLPVAERLQDLSKARLATEVDGRRYYLAPSTGDDICLLATFGEGDALTSAGTCESLRRIATSGIYLAEGDALSSFKIAVVVPDGVDEVATQDGSLYRVESNVALIPSLSGEEIRFIGGAFDGVVINTGLADRAA